MKQALRSVPSVFVITFWVIMMGLLVKKEFVPENILPQRISFPEGLPSIKNWGIYTKTARLGSVEVKIGEAGAGFNLNLAYEDMAMNLVGVIEGDSFKLKIKTNGIEKEYTLPWSAWDNIIPWLYMPNLKIGDKFKWHLFNPLTQRRDLVIGVVRRSSFYYNKKDFLPVMVVDVYYKDTKTEFWVDAEGNPLKVITPWGWELVAE